jgi:hypothetical protein
MDDEHWYRKALEFLIKDYVETLPENMGQEEAATSVS